MKVEVMQHAVAKCPELKIKCEGIKIPPLIDLASEVTLLCQSPCEKYLKHVISPSSTSKRQVCSLF